MKKRWVIGVSGASGMRYTLRLMRHLLDADCELHVVFSDAALRVLAEEEEMKLSNGRLSAENLLGTPSDHVYFYNPKDIGAAIASGSFQTEGMVVCPCSMGTLAAVANGFSQNLVHRAADVTLKEGRRLVMVPRETPLSAIHLENMLTLSRIGVSICAAMPGFYHQPKTINDLVDMQVMKIMDQMGIRRDLVQRWRENGDADQPATVAVGHTGARVIELKRE